MIDRRPSSREGPFDAQMRRLVEGLAPGRPLGDFVGWCARMREQYGAEPVDVVQRAVDLALKQLTSVPPPARFRPYVEVAVLQLARERRAALPAPPPLTAAEEREREARSRAARERIKQLLKGGRLAG